MTQTQKRVQQVVKNVCLELKVALTASKRNSVGLADSNDKAAGSRDPLGFAGQHPGWSARRADCMILDEKLRKKIPSLYIRRANHLHSHKKPFFPKQLQLMGFSILAKKQTLLQHDFHVCLPLSPFYWILFRHDFQVCHPLSPFYWILFRHDFQVCLPLSPFYWILFRHDFQVCLPLSPFYWILFRHDFQVCHPLSPFYWILFRHDFQVCLPLSPFYWILFRHDFQVCLPLSPFYWILFRHDF